jgi:hypothetical protein
MKRIPFFLLLTLVVSFFVVSCKKDETVTPAVNTAELLARKWVPSELYIDVDSKKTYLYGPSKDASVSLSLAVSADDYMLLNKDGSVVNVEDGVTSKGTWSLKNDNTQVVISIDGDVMPYTISNLTEKSVELSYSTPVAQIGSAPGAIQGLYLLASFAGLIKTTPTNLKYGVILSAK